MHSVLAFQIKYFRMSSLDWRRHEEEEEEERKKLQEFQFREFDSGQLYIVAVGCAFLLFLSKFET